MSNTLPLEEFVAIEEELEAIFETVQFLGMGNEPVPVNIIGWIGKKMSLQLTALDEYRSTKLEGKGL